MVKIEGERERAKRVDLWNNVEEIKKLVKGESERWTVKGREREYNCTKTKMD